MVTEDSKREPHKAPKKKQESKPQWVEPRIVAAPKVRQIYWCDFWNDAQLPEMWKTRPVIVISYKNTLHGVSLVIPTSTDPQDHNPWAHKLSMQIDGISQSWAICNQPSSVATSRFSQFKGNIPLIPKDDFNVILSLLHKWLPKHFDIEK